MLPTTIKEIRLDKFKTLISYKSTDELEVLYKNLLVVYKAFDKEPEMLIVKNELRERKIDDLLNE